MANANILAILIAAASGFLVGGIWYGPLFGKAWQRAIGLSDDELKSATDFYRTMMISTGIALGFVAPAIGTNYLYGRKSGKLFAIDAGYWIIFYAAMGLVFGLLGA